MIRMLLAVCCALTLVACASTPRSAAPGPTRDAIIAANRELCDRYNRGDRIGVARMYAEDALMIDHAGRRWEGRQAIDDYWKPRGPISPDERWELDVLSVEGDAEYPVQRGRSRLLTQREGQRHISDVQFLLFWKRQPDGEYRILLDAWWPTPVTAVTR